MYKRKRILGLIPARGGSKGLPGKNLLPLLGKPLVAWAIENALTSKLLDGVVVSTDDAEIAKISRRFGADVPFMRPAHLATDTASSYDVIFHALDFFSQKGIEYDYLALLEPTSPLRKVGDIDKAIKLLVDKGDEFDSIISLGKIALENPQLAKKVNAEGKISPFTTIKKGGMRRQDFEVAYFPYGVIYLAKTISLRKKATFYQKKTMPYFIERWQNYEVDDIYDFKCIEAVLKLRKEQGL